MIEINKLQLFALLQDTVTHIKFGQHLAPNFRSVKQSVLAMFGASKRTSSRDLLAYIGHLYIQELKQPKKFTSYIEKHNLTDVYNKAVNKLAQD